MSTITARIPDDLNAALTQVAKQTERSKSHIILKAIQNYVLELQEDIEDYNDAERILAQNNPTYSLEEVMKELGFEEWKEKMTKWQIKFDNCKESIK
ncbi:ribbon-helix-helix domain-containing protein (plasmid) [Candidatus Megaera polyxenophila]|uniref:type II toxin-antitoxin system RelB family antitoxin n=1 Tax=Candidatus Megaera polyxenophila TaxID=988779 RepID=UPI00249E8732|nr:ribbon-helix-helix domain-containing protein [Candidatus Megaera polyxenophila]